MDHVDVASRELVAGKMSWYKLNSIEEPFSFPFLLLLPTLSKGLNLCST